MEPDPEFSQEDDGEGIGGLFTANLLSPNLPDLKQARLAFVDVEGQGTQSSQYDSVLASPLLLSSPVVLFNIQGAPNSHSTLTSLAMLANCARSVASTFVDKMKVEKACGKSDSSDEVTEHKPGFFGHLHCIFRDYMFSADRETVSKTLLEEEKLEVREERLEAASKRAHKQLEIREAAVLERNEIRRLIKVCFSLFCLFPLFCFSRTIVV